MLTYGSVTNGREFVGLNPNQMELNVLAGGKDTNSLVQTLPASAPAYLLIQSGLKKVLVYWTPEAVPLPPRIYKKLLQDRSWLENNLPVNPFIKQ